MKSLQAIAEELMMGENPDQLALEVGMDRVNDAISMLEDRV
jgi:hypothetical protein